MRTVTEQFAETLAAAGAKRIYGTMGDSLNGLTDAIRRQGTIEWVHVRHEEVAAFAAGAEVHVADSLANNGALGFIELEQKSTGFLDFGTELQNPNFVAMAEAIGIRSIRLCDPAKVNDGIAEALTHDGPVLIDAAVNRTELVMPPTVTAEMAKGFSLYMVKAVMNGRADEVIDLARTNLWR